MKSEFQWPDYELSVLRTQQLQCDQRFVTWVLSFEDHDNRVPSCLKSAFIPA